MPLKFNTRLVTSLKSTLRRQVSLPQRLDAIQEALGRIESRQLSSLPVGNSRDYEFKVYSQWGEDGIIDYLVNRIPGIPKTFVEFGVETYVEANTIFLLKHRHWRGLIIDGSDDNMKKVRESSVYWRYGLVTDSSFIDRDNINVIITRNGFSGELGLLSVDIDGNDYWVWQAMDCVKPVIIVSEYNSLFGSKASISVPYKADFWRTSAHPSNMYYGASIRALTELAESRGYSLVAGNSAGNNAFFVRNDCMNNLRAIPVEEAYVQAEFRESKGADGEVDLLDFASRQRAIGNLPVVNVASGAQLPLSAALAQFGL